MCLIQFLLAQDHSKCEKVDVKGHVRADCDLVEALEHIFPNHLMRLLVSDLSELSSINVMTAKNLVLREKPAVFTLKIPICGCYLTDMTSDFPA